MANNNGDSMFGLNFMLNKAVAMNIRILLQYAPPNAGIRLAGESFLDRLRSQRRADADRPVHGHLHARARQRDLRPRQRGHVA